ncbi:hypothetical protein AB1Y20_012263 [Prymnesium parvum]|uniref:Gamma-glutamylcyclotransferase n=1 Tax=Prymnesium parvum TaxID=97485 RepID=A0AB34INY9_PRYPA
MQRPQSAHTARTDATPRPRPESARARTSAKPPAAEPPSPPPPKPAIRYDVYAGGLSASIARHRVALMSGSLEERRQLSWVGTRQPSDVWCFAAGSLMNRHILASHDLHPKAAVPASLLSHQLLFSGAPAAACLLPSAEACVHGVLYKFSGALLPKLEAVHAGGQAARACAQLYTGAQVECLVFRSDEAVRAETALPTALYLSILVEGATQHHVDASYVETLKSHEAIPRKPASAFATFPMAATPVKMRMEALEAHLDAHLRADVGFEDCLIVVNKKVLKWVGPADHPLLATVRRRPIDKTLEEAQQKYDPLYGRPSSLRDMSDEHKAYVEDAWASSFLALFECLGFVDYEAPPPPPKEEDEE